MLISEWPCNSIWLLRCSVLLLISVLIVLLVLLCILLLLIVVCILLWVVVRVVLVGASVLGVFHVVFILCSDLREMLVKKKEILHWVLESLPWETHWMFALGLLSSWGTRLQVDLDSQLRAPLRGDESGTSEWLELLVLSAMSHTAENLWILRQSILHSRE